jgi:hypothetical protein
MNTNVKATYGFYFTMSLASGIIGTVSSNFLYDLTSQNLYVGLAGAEQKEKREKHKPITHVSSLAM